MQLLFTSKHLAASFGKAHWKRSVLNSIFIIFEAKNDQQIPVCGVETPRFLKMDKNSSI